VGWQSQIEEKKMKKFLVFVFTLAFSACTAPSTAQPIATSLPPAEILTTPQIPPSQNEDPSVMTTYTDNVAGFSLDYPTGWYVESSIMVHAEEVTNYSISISSWDITIPPTPSEKQLSGLPEGGTKFDVTVIKDATTLEAAVEQVGQTGTPILARSDVTLTNGVPAVILDIEGFGGHARMLISIINGNFIYVTGYGNLDYFEPVALSLRAK
jgi:hypothetical protein